MGCRAYACATGAELVELMVAKAGMPRAVREYYSGLSAWRHHPQKYRLPVQIPAGLRSMPAKVRVARLIVKPADEGKGTATDAVRAMAKAQRACGEVEVS